jgi:hypothetical protein
MLIFRVGLWPYSEYFCSEQLPLRWLWISAIAEHLDYTRCNPQNRWHSVDTLLTFCWHSVDAVMMLCWRSVDAPLTLCWRSFGGVAVSTNTILPVKAANTSIMHKCRSTTFGLPKMQPTKSLTLCWHSCSDWGSDHIAIACIQNGCQYVDSGYIP